MAPRKSSKGKAQAFTDDQLEGPSNDQRFETLGCELIFEERFSGRSCIQESLLKYRNSARGILDGVVGAMLSRHWGFMLDNPTLANCSIVREFYANIRDRNAPVVYVRGIQVPMDVHSIATTLHLPVIEDAVADFAELMANQTLEQLDMMKSVIATPDTPWTYGTDGRPRRILSGYLTTEARAWMFALNSYVRPTGHHSDVTIDQIILIFACVTGRPLCLASYIHHMLGEMRAAAKNTGLPYPGMITRLARAVRVPELPDDDRQLSIDKVDLAKINNLKAGSSNKKKRASETPIDAPDISTRPSTASVQGGLDALATRQDIETLRKEMADDRVAQRRARKQMMRSLKAHTTQMLRESEERILKRMAHYFRISGQPQASEPAPEDDDDEDDDDQEEDEEDDGDDEEETETDDD